MTNAPAPWTAAVLAVLPSLSSSAKYGDRKFFLSAIADAIGTAPAVVAAGLLWEMRAARGGSPLVFSRADLIAAMDPAMVAASEVDLDGAIVHFVALA